MLLMKRDSRNYVLLQEKFKIHLLSFLTFHVTILLANQLSQ